MGALLTAGIVLAGGRATRLGGVDKALVTLDGSTLLDRTLAALAAVAGELVVVGPNRPAAGIVGPHRPATGIVGPHRPAAATVAYRLVRESPLFAGPAMALAAGVAALADLPDAAVVTVLPCDLVHPAAAIAALETWAAAGSASEVRRDGAVLVTEGRRQWATVRVRLGALRQATEAARPNASLRGLFAGLTLSEIPIAPDLLADLDTLEQVRRLGASLPNSHTTPRPDHDESGLNMSRDVHPDLEPWVAQLAPQLGLEPAEVPLAAILELASEVAHGVVRPGAPVTAFMVGLALGSGRAESIEAALTSVREEAARWAESKAGDA